MNAHPSRARHVRAVLQALLVTFLWSVSFVMIKVGLVALPPLTFAGLRYSLAAAVLLIPVLARPTYRASLRGLRRGDWGRLLVLGVVYYTITQGSQFVALNYLPSATVSLLLNFTVIVIALLAIWLLAEVPTWAQWGGVVVSLLGAVVYFYPIDLPTATLIGIGAALVGMFANSAASVLGRYVNRSESIPPLTVTAVSMGIGALLMLIIGLAVEPLPVIGAEYWALIVVLAVVNTAFAFTLWNVSLQVLPAVESGIINNTMLIQIAVLAWLFLGESLTGKEIVGLVLVAVGTLIVQVRRARVPAAAASAGPD